MNSAASRHTSCTSSRGICAMNVCFLPKRPFLARICRESVLSTSPDATELSLGIRRRADFSVGRRSVGERPQSATEGALPLDPLRLATRSKSTNSDPKPPTLDRPNIEQAKKAFPTDVCARRLPAACAPARRGNDYKSPAEVCACVMFSRGSRAPERASGKTSRGRTCRGLRWCAAAVRWGAKHYRVRAGNKEKSKRL